MGGIADAKKTGAVPLGEAVDLYGEEFDLVPVGEFVYAGFTVGAAGAEEGNEAGDAGSECW